MEQGIKRIKPKIIPLEKLNELIPSHFKNNKNMKRTGSAGIFAGSLELVKEGNVKLKQEKIFGDIYIRNNE